MTDIESNLGKLGRRNLDRGLGKRGVAGIDRCQRERKRRPRYPLYPARNPASALNLATNPQNLRGATARVEPILSIGGHWRVSIVPTDCFSLSVRALPIMLCRSSSDTLIAPVVGM